MAKNPLDDLVVNSINTIKSGLEISEADRSLYRVDGSIIGTGRPDFTRDATSYELTHCGKKFALINSMELKL